MTQTASSTRREFLALSPEVTVFAVRLTRIDNSGDDRIFVESSWIDRARFETRHEANIHALAVIKFPHIINVEVIEL
jgi:hypothetical protein